MCKCADCVTGKIPASGCSLPKHEYTEVNGTRCWNCGAAKPYRRRQVGDRIEPAKDGCLMGYHLRDDRGNEITGVASSSIVRVER